MKITKMKYLIVLCLFFQVVTSTAYGQAYKYHTVSPGETVFSISQKYGISEAAIYKYNPDAKNGIQISSKLVIPVVEDNTVNNSAVAENSPVSFTSHKVEKKETLYSLSKQYNVDIEDIKKYNKQLYSKELQKGETVQIPVFGKAPFRNVKTEVPSSPKSEISRNPAKTPQISKTREHIIIPKETKYGIARKYGMTVAELEALNPTVDVLQPGIMLKVGTNVLDEPVIITDNAFEFYEVQPQETLYSLTKRFQIEQDSLIALNPALKDGLKYGMVLKVPTKDAYGRELKEVSAEKAENAITSKVQSLSLENKIKDFKTKNIVLMLPYGLNKVRIDSTSNAGKVLESDRVMRISLDFYSGVLMAVKKAKDLGISTNLKIYDSQQQTSSVSSFINSNSFSNVDAVIGPLLQATSEEAAQLLSNKNIPVISPMTNRELRSISNLYQSMPTDDMLRDAMISYLQKNSQDKNVIVIADGANTATKSKLMNAMPNARTVSVSGNNVTESSLASLMSTSRENWVILESESVALLSTATSALFRQARKNNITLFTTNKNKSFESDVLLNEHLGKLKFHYPSEYKEFDENNSDSFIDAYKEKYGYLPNKYTTRGYDLTLDVLLRLGAMGTLEKSVQENIITEYVENEFHYKKKANGGFYNSAVYIMALDENLNLNVAN